MEAKCWMDVSNSKNESRGNKRHEFILRQKMWTYNMLSRIIGRKQETIYLLVQGIEILFVKN